MNTVQLIGRLTSGPEITTTANDKSYTRITLAVNRQFKNSDGEREADFIPCVFWGKQAETFTSYAKKGMLLAIQGELRVYSFEGKDKERHYMTEVLGNRFEFLESRQTIALREGQAENKEMILEAEELPF